jgi:hypothetical protein
MKANQFLTVFCPRIFSADRGYGGALGKPVKGMTDGQYEKEN